jgi:predicted enzyme related to lactoylglutathione lyase
MTRFFQYQLRTTDVPAARAFYSAVFGNAESNIIQLHEHSIARGARPHWLGYLGVADVDPAVSAFVARGASPLGPKLVNPEGLEFAVMRDPGGAVVALAKPAPRPVDSAGAAARAQSQTDVAWHLLHTADVERAKANYGELFGWALKERLDLGNLGVFHPFAWQSGEAPVGAMSDVADRRGVHPHWLFHVRVPALEPALEAVHARGGVVVARVLVPNGDHIAVCDDAQGAAFALRTTR